MLHLRAGKQIALKTEPYKKTWVVTTKIARELISLPEGEKLPTVGYISDVLCTSHGIVQKALLMLEESGCVEMKKQGRGGTVLIKKNPPLLFEAAGIKGITGAMPLPLNTCFAGLATGLYDVFSSCPAPFGFAFLHGAQTRVDALLRETYDFVVVSRAAAMLFLERHAELDLLADYKSVQYSGHFALFINRKGATRLHDGFTVGVDQQFTDQMILTQLVCSGKKVRFVPMAYQRACSALVSGEIECLVARVDDIAASNIFTVIPLETDGGPDMTTPALLCNRNAFGMKNILSSYLDEGRVCAAQQTVMNLTRDPCFY